jgi:hypothetical protein
VAEGEPDYRAVAGHLISNDCQVRGGTLRLVEFGLKAKGR